MGDPALGRVPRAAAVDVCVAKVENGHHPAIVVYVDDLYLHFLAQDLALQGSVGFLSIGLAGLGYDPGPLVDVLDLGSVYATEARELLPEIAHQVFSGKVPRFGWHSRHLFKAEVAKVNRAAASVYPMPG